MRTCTASICHIEYILPTVEPHIPTPQLSGCSDYLAGKYCFSIETHDMSDMCMSLKLNSTKLRSYCVIHVYICTATLKHKVVQYHGLFFLFPHFISKVLFTLDAGSGFNLVWLCPHWIWIELMRRGSNLLTQLTVGRSQGIHRVLLAPLVTSVRLAVLYYAM